MPIRILVTALVLFVTIAFVSTWTNAQNDTAKSNGDLRQLLTERRDTLQKRLDVLQFALSQGEADVEELLTAELDLLDAKLELATEPASRITVLKEVVARMREAEDRTNQLVQNGDARRYDLLLVKAERLKAEINLLRATEMSN